LIENAIKYTPKGGKVRLELLKNSTGSVEISVCDNGLGIPREDRERVKARFVRLDKSRTHPGNGLGLSLVDAVANFHNAEFIISSVDDHNVKRPGLKAAIVFPKNKIK
jgi:signal transduction histidine kinase